MGQDVKRKHGETFESLLRRFSRRVIESGKLIQAKKVRFYERPKSRGLRRKSALLRAKMQSQREYLKRIGKLKEEPRDRRSKYIKFNA